MRTINIKVQEVLAQTVLSLVPNRSTHKDHSVDLEPPLLTQAHKASTLDLVELPEVQACLEVNRIIYPVDETSI
jgi:hypothetical protein